MYNNYDTESNLFSLNGCQAQSISYEDGLLSFYFPNGFWIFKKHTENNLSDTVCTDNSMVTYHILNEEIDGISIYIFSKTKNKKVIREDWEPKNFINALNNKDFYVEFIKQYNSCQSVLHKCWIRFEQEPYHKECEIIINYDKVTYCWNKLC